MKTKYTHVCEKHEEKYSNKNALHGPSDPEKPVDWDWKVGAYSASLLAQLILVSILLLLLFLCHKFYIHLNYFSHQGISRQMCVFISSFPLTTLFTSDFNP